MPTESNCGPLRGILRLFLGAMLVIGVLTLNQRGVGSIPTRGAALFDKLNK